MVKKDATQQVLDLQGRVATAKTKLIEAQTKKKTAEEQLLAADDAIEELGLDPDRDLERQVTKLIEVIEKEMTQLEEYLSEAESVLKRS